ncbi:MAG: CoA ester lyase [Tissierellia bacterium]|nr:CoA ester lyase [Tissierellia bacterium]
MNRRTLLFMPGNNPGMIFSADVLGADTIIFDLEDAVALDEKDSARTLVRQGLKDLEFENSEVCVRINPTDSPYWQKDLDEILQENLDTIMIPKANVESVQMIQEYIDNKNISKDFKESLQYILLIESPLDLLHLEDICKGCKNLSGIALGGEDYSSSLGVQRTKGSKELEYARYVIATVGKAYGIDAIDTPYTDVEDEEGLLEELALAKTIGLNGSLVIGPRLIDIINNEFSPTEEEIEEAKIILELNENAKKEGLGVFSYRGKMVDRPVILRAENTISSAKNWGLYYEE